jgi:hypothetical protein
MVANNVFDFDVCAVHAAASQNPVTGTIAPVINVSAGLA